MIETSGPRGSEMQVTFVPGDAPPAVGGAGLCPPAKLASSPAFSALGTGEACRGWTLPQATLKIRLRHMEA